jgi:pimeloyl-ACP methyl ester carboxylesterase
MRTNFHPQWPWLVPLCAAVILIGCFKNPGHVEKTTVSFDSHGYALVADLYAPRRPNGVGIVLVHGSSAAGRNLLLYPELCRALGARGYTLLNVDLRGYGDSEDPHRLDRLEDYDFVGDARRAALVAHSLIPQARPWPWIIIGHSMGGGVAVHAALQSDDIRGVICISPGRRIEARFFQGSNSQIKNLQRRKTRDMRLSEPIPLHLLQPILESYDVGPLAGTAISKPLLLLEGGREPAKDLEFSRAWVTSLTGPVTHQVIDGADHYFGTALVKSDGIKKWQTTRPDVFDALVEMIDDWIQANIPTPASP